MAQYASPWMTPDLVDLKDATARFVANEITPNAERWSRQGYVDKSLWKQAGDLGILCADVTDEYGGSGGHFGHDAVIATELAAGGGNSFRICRTIHVIAAHYLEAYGTPEQKARWLPGLCSGDLVAGVAMTEPSGGSDLQSARTKAVRDGDLYRINGSKTFITNGSTADLLLLAVKTDITQGARGMSMILFDTTTPGFRVGQRLEKVGLHASDTCELFFDDCEVSADCLLGPVEGRGFYQMMEQLPYERVAAAVGACANVQIALALTLAYTRERQAFGKPIIEFQNTKFELADIKTKALTIQVFTDHVIGTMIEKTTDSELASMAKYWISEQQGEIIDRCVQLFGGYGYVTEYPIARMYADARIERIYGGTSEIMKEIISRTL